MAIDHVVRQAERDAEFAYLVLEQLAQRLEEIEIERLGKAADIVMALDRMCLLGLGAGRFDHVRVNGPLRQPPGVVEPARFGLENLDELAADDLAFLFRVGDALEVAEEAGSGIDVNDLDAEIAGEGLHHLLGFVEAQEPVINEHAGQLVTNRAMDQRCGDRGVDAAGKAEDHLVMADLRTDPGHRLANVVGHVPVASAAADVAYEAADDFLALERVRHLGMKLHGVESARLVSHGRNRRRFVAAD